MLKVGLVGTGMMGRFHAARYLQMPNVDLIAIADAMPERLEPGHVVHGNMATDDGEFDFDRIQKYADGRELIAQARDRVWRITTAGEKPDAGLAVVSMRQLDAGVEYRVLGDPSGQYDATPIEPSLEDGYIWLMRQRQGLVRA